MKRVEEVRDLGFTVTPSLDFKSHWANQILKSKRLIYLVFKSFYSRDPKFLTSLFKTYIRPLLEYGTTITSPAEKCGIESIEKVQNLFSRKVFMRKFGFDCYQNMDSSKLFRNPKDTNQGCPPRETKNQRSDPTHFPGESLSKSISSTSIYQNFYNDP
ncbi:unnamed protein product [Caenorhabditis angaria]|uniref:Glycosyltransferase family 92 protein n=1 Tax=Caenorhabditis angaria TaxID=860376 RepID=A0A9P1IK08_9PELO|nr:unnamed protein product [Caenorhabditis angaria]